MRCAARSAEQRFMCSSSAMHLCPTATQVIATASNIVQHLALCKRASEALVVRQLAIS
eukprot:m.1109568 g.1109568  ORF g.1109568 m.1109568 type:complete len:58 (+) comp24353_c0_seq14:1213-1386(+)